MILADSSRIPLKRDESRNFYTFRALLLRPVFCQPVFEAITVTSATTYPAHSLDQVHSNVVPTCDCSAEDHEQNHLLRGILVAVPTGLVAWVGLLKVAVVLLRHY
jgi:hypothetical protein